MQPANASRRNTSYRSIAEKKTISLLFIIIRRACTSGLDSAAVTAATDRTQVSLLFYINIPTLLFFIYLPACRQTVTLRRQRRRRRRRDHMHTCTKRKDLDRLVDDATSRSGGALISGSLTPSAVIG